MQDGARPLTAQQLHVPHGAHTNTFMNFQTPTTQIYQQSYIEDQRSLPPEFVPMMYRDTAAEITVLQGRAVYYHNPQFYQPAHDSQQIFEQQQEAMKLMATTIGSKISKGFVMPKKVYMTFNGNPLDYPSFITNFGTNVGDVESDPNVRCNYLIQLCTGKAKEAISGSVMLPPEEG